MTAVDQVAALLRDLPLMQAGVMSGHGAGVRRAAALAASLGDPQEDLRVVHVAGTAGKGSVCAFADALLTAHGHRVGRYVSPHAHSLLERFTVAGAPVDASDLGAVLADVRAVGEGAASMFEVSTVAAYELFRRARVDYAVVETGLGGRHDATNIVRRPDKLAVLTAIGRDHVEVLGHTIGEIAGQKAGILPYGGLGVGVRSGPEADAVVAREARDRWTRLDLRDPDRLAAGLPPGTRLRLPGPHQRVNAGLALDAVAALAERDGWALRPGAVLRGLAAAALPGRFEERSLAGHPVVLDGAHNPMKIAGLRAALEERHPGARPVWVVALKPDKDLVEVLRVLAPACTLLVASGFDADDPVSAVDPDEVVVAARAAGIASAASREDMGEALERAVAASAPGVPVVVTGSFHAVAAAGRRTSTMVRSTRAG